MMLSACSTVPVATKPPQAEFQPFPAGYMQKCDPLPPFRSGINGKELTDQILSDDAQYKICMDSHNGLIDEINKRIAQTHKAP